MTVGLANSKTINCEIGRFSCRMKWFIESYLESRISKYKIRFILCYNVSIYLHHQYDRNNLYLNFNSAIPLSRHYLKNTIHSNFIIAIKTCGLCVIMVPTLRWRDQNRVNIKALLQTQSMVKFGVGFQEVGPLGAGLKYVMTSNWSTESIL